MPQIVEIIRYLEQSLYLCKEETNSQFTFFSLRALLNHC